MPPMSRQLRRLAAPAVHISCILGCALLVNPGAALAAPVQWTGQGTSALWSEALNWSPAGAPLDGDGLVFAAMPARTSTVFDLARSFSALTFNADAPLFTTHVLGDGARLAFVGAGIRSLGAVGAPTGRQSFFADAGSVGGTILFANSAGINVVSDQFARPVDLTAQGGAVAGAIGGHIVFQDSATTSGTTFDVVRAQGASVAGASGGEVIFRDNAVLSRQASLVVGGGDAGLAGVALGGQASFLGHAQLAGGASLLAGQAGGSGSASGLGGRLGFSGNAAGLGTSSIYAQGGTSAVTGAEAVASFRGDAVFMGSAYLGAGGVDGANGGRIEFFDHSSHDTTSFPAVTGTLGIYNVGAVAAGARGGALVFHDDAAIRGTHLAIYNQTAEYLAPGALAGSTSFLDRSRAGQVQIENAGAVGAGAGGGATYFRDQSSAESSAITSLGGAALGGGGGSTAFSDSASAGAAILRNGGGSAAGALGGTLDFSGASQAGMATIINAPGEVPGAAGGVTTFSGTAGGGQAYISNQSSLSAGGGGRGTTLFSGASSAQQAVIDNQGGLFTINAYTAFSQASTAGNALITNFGGAAPGASGGFTTFADQSSAGAATLVMAGGGVSGALGGRASFFAGSNAGSATLMLQGADVVGAAGGSLDFGEGASAGNARITVQGSQANSVGGPEGAVVSFVSHVSGAGLQASASAASFSIGGNLYAFGSPGRVFFNDGSTAGTASFVTVAGYDRGGRLSFEGTAAHLSDAGSANITNGSRVTASPSTGDFGGATIFLARSSADHATIRNEAGLTAFGAQTVFRADSTAADASIVNAGGRAGDTGGITYFNDSANAGRARIVSQAGGLNASGLTVFTDTSSAAQATLIAEGGSVNGGGGRIEFQRQSTGGSARVVLNAGSSINAGGVLDISAVDVWLAVGSIEGGGAVNLGARSLIVAGNGRATTFSGVIRGDAPPVFPSLSVLGGSLTLSGGNLYAGRTSIGDGVNADSGKLVASNTSGSATGSGAVLIERGGTLSGSGSIDGAVTLRPGGTLAPGDPVTLTLRSSLTWDGGGVIRLVVGPDSAQSDHLDIGSLQRGADGPFVFELVDAGIVVGTSYDLLRIGSVSGFVASDFSVIGAVGSFAFDNTGSLAFTAAAVPEPATWLLMAMGLGALLLRARRRGLPGPLNPPASGRSLV